MREKEYVRENECVWERERVCVSLCGREKECVCACVKDSERERLRDNVDH